MASSELPLPPFQLAARVGSLEGSPDPWKQYEAIGTASKRDVEEILPADYDFLGRRVLDFGCGAGRTLRHFVADDMPGEYWGCDIDAESIGWLQDHLSPPLHVFVNDELPPLPRPDAFFDVIYAVSVFTHLTRTWSSWLPELHRVLKPSGLLIATFMGEGQSDAIAGEAWNEENVGMLVLQPGQPWELGGPMVLHSPWWIREHWGRLFGVFNLRAAGFAGDDPMTGHGLVGMRKKDVRLAPSEIERPGPDVREATALAHNRNRLIEELERLRPEADRLRREVVTGRGNVATLTADNARLERELACLANSRSWRLTRPIRRIGRELRAARTSGGSSRPE